MTEFSRLRSGVCGLNQESIYGREFSCPNIAGGGAAGVTSLFFVYSLEFARKRLANDVKSSKKRAAGERQFNRLFDVYMKMIASVCFFKSFAPANKRNVKIILHINTKQKKGWYRRIVSWFCDFMRFYRGV